MPDEAAAAFTLHFDTALLPEGWARRVRLQIEGGRIRRIERDCECAPADERHGIALPGLHNVHSHAFQRAMVGRTGMPGPAADTFWSWRETMYGFAHGLTPEDARSVAAQAFMEMLESGYTRVGEFHYLHHDPQGRPYTDPAEMSAQIIAAAAESGIGLTLLPVFYAQSDFGAAPPLEAQRRFVCDLDTYERLLESATRQCGALPDAIIGVAPHSLRAADPSALRAIATLRPTGPIHIHVAEGVGEVDACLAWSGQRPVQWLLDHQPVDARWCLVHATQTTAAELRGIANSGAVVGLCPMTEGDLGDGIFAARPYLSAGGRFGIGSDSNVSIDPAAELRMLEYGQRLLTHSRNVLALTEGFSVGRTLFSAAVQGGSQALGTWMAGSDTACGLVEGASADIVTLDSSCESLAGLDGDALLDGWIFGTGARLIDRVWRRGKCVVREGHHVARRIIAPRYAQTLRRLAQ